MNNKADNSFYLLTDIHYVSKNKWVEGKPINNRERGDQIALKSSPEIFEAFAEKILADSEINTVVITGDNVDGGDILSHEEFREKIRALKAAGKNVYITVATHDYCSTGEDECCFHSACRYTETGTEPIPFMRRNELFDFYREFGPDQALSVHDESGSYTVKIGEGLRLIAIVDNGNGRSHCGLFEDGVEWLKGQIAGAKEAGDYVLLAVHHPVIPPWDVYSHMVDYEMYGGYRELWNLMWDENVRVIFTGHTHVQNIRKLENDAGSWFVDVSTISLANAAGKMRKVTVDTETGMCDIKSVGIENLPGTDTGGLSAYEYLYTRNFPGIVQRILPLASKDFDEFLKQAEGFLPVDKLAGKKFLVKRIANILMRRKLSSLIRFGRSGKLLSKEQKKYAKSVPLTDIIYEILRHIFTGNAPYTPDTVENIVLSAVCRRLDRLVEKLNVEKVKGMIPPGSSLNEMAQDFLYNTRTGDDDSIMVQLIK